MQMHGRAIARRHSPRMQMHGRAGEPWDGSRMRMHGRAVSRRQDHTQWPSGVDHAYDDDMCESFETASRMSNNTSQDVSLLCTRVLVVPDPIVGKK